MSDPILTARGFPEHYVRVTDNGEITYNPETGEYIAWDEIYCDPVCITPHELCARAALKAYAEHYL